MTSWPSIPRLAAVLDPVGSVMNGILRDAWVSLASRMSSDQDALVLGRFKITAHAATRRDAHGAGDNQEIAPELSAMALSSASEGCAVYISAGAAARARPRPRPPALTARPLECRCKLCGSGSQKATRSHARSSVTRRARGVSSLLPRIRAVTALRLASLADQRDGERAQPIGVDVSQLQHSRHVTPVSRALYKASTRWRRSARPRANGGSRLERALSVDRRGPRFPR